MPITLPPSLRDPGEAPHARTDWIWLLELEVQKRTKVLPPVVFRITTYPQLVSWPPSGSSPPTLSWYPYPFDATAIEEDQEGNLPAIDITLDNTFRTLMRYLHAGQGMEGNAAELRLINVAGLSGPLFPDQEERVWTFVIASAIASDQSITFRLEKPNMFQRRVPGERFSARRCRWRFGSDECGYPINAVAAFTTCAKTIPDCEARGDDEVVRRLPRLHPRRFGGFPGIPTQRGPQ